MRGLQQCCSAEIRGSQVGGVIDLSSNNGEVRWPLRKVLVAHRSKRQECLSSECIQYY